MLSDVAVTTILLADDHPLVRAGLRALLDAQPDMRVIGEAADGSSACARARELLPDVIVLDLSMPGLSGNDVTQRLKRECPALKIVVLTVHEEPSLVMQTIKAGAHAYVLKRSASEDLVDAVRVVLSDESYIDRSMGGTLVKNYLLNADAPSRDDALSPREREVLVRIARGFSNKEIAAELAISVKTVETYKMRLATKAGLHSRVEIVRYAAQRGWLTAF